MAITGLDHIVVRVKDIDEGIESYKKMGLELTKQMETDGIGKQAIFRLADNTFIELVAPTDPKSPVGAALEKRGEGIHTVAFNVDNLEKTVDHIKGSGAIVIQSDDMKGTAFVHPKATHGVLLQVSEKK